MSFENINFEKFARLLYVFYPESVPQDNESYELVEILIALVLEFNKFEVDEKTVTALFAQLRGLVSDEYLRARFNSLYTLTNQSSTLYPNLKLTQDHHNLLQTLRIDLSSNPEVKAGIFQLFGKLAAEISEKSASQSLSSTYLKNIILKEYLTTILKLESYEMAHYASSAYALHGEVLNVAEGYFYYETNIQQAPNGLMMVKIYDPDYVNQLPQPVQEQLIAKRQHLIDIAQRELVSSQLFMRLNHKRNTEAKFRLCLLPLTLINRYQVTLELLLFEAIKNMQIEDSTAAKKFLWNQIQENPLFGYEKFCQLKGDKIWPLSLEKIKDPLTWKAFLIRLALDSLQDMYKFKFVMDKLDCKQIVQEPNNSLRLVFK